MNDHTAALIVVWLLRSVKRLAFAESQRYSLFAALPSLLTASQHAPHQLAAGVDVGRDGELGG